MSTSRSVNRYVGFGGNDCETSLAPTTEAGDEGDDVDEETRRFNREIKAIEELERWETRITEIPDSALQQAFLQTM